jgi:xanthine/uracil/vitamin C permease (AzgA family)
MSSSSPRFTPQGFTYSIANGICFGFICWSFLSYVRWSWQYLTKNLLKRPTWALPEDVDCAAPHWLMTLMSIFMALRFVYLAA